MTVTTALLSFALAAGLVTLTPGLDTALVLRTAAVEGRRPAVRAALGIAAGVLAWGLVAALGLGAVFAVSRTAYDLLRWVGAAYLLWLGIRLLLRAPARLEALSDSAAPQGSWLARGFLTNMLNPKVGAFYVTFLPQFIPEGVPVVAFSAGLAAIHAIEGLFWFAALILATERLNHWLRRPSVGRTIDRLTGGVLIAFGLKLALESRG